MENTQHPNEVGGSNFCNVDHLSQKFYKNYKGLYEISPSHNYCSTTMGLCWLKTVIHSRCLYSSLRLLLMVLRVELYVETLAKKYNLDVKVLIPQCLFSFTILSIYTVSLICNVSSFIYD